MVEQVQEKPKRLGDKLIDSGFITEEHLKLAIRKQNKDGCFLGQALVDLGFVDEKTITDILAVDSTVEYFDISNVIIDSDIVKLIPLNIAKKYNLIAFDVNDTHVSVCMSDPLNIIAIDEVWKSTGKAVKVFAASTFDIVTAINSSYSQQETLDEIIDVIMERDMFSNIEDATLEAPIVRLIDLIIVQAIRLNGTDIHFNALEKLLKVKVRVDGTMNKMALLPLAVSNPLVSRLKIMAGLDPSERRLPQDGRFTVNVGTHNIEMRVSILKSQFGENAVLRVLDKERMKMTLDGIGMPSYIVNEMREEIKSPHGMLLVTGPTGSGKTTTLYSMLNEMDSETKNLFTIEDPVEFVQDGVQQISVNSDIDLTFSEILRSILRQDPDVVMLGEIRDHETAEIAFRAAMTGHLLLSTLHTNSAIETVFRIMDMGIDAYLIPSVLNGILAQRLVRKLCGHCKVEMDDDYNRKTRERFNIDDDSVKFFSSSKQGCEHCNKSGYSGRFAIYEFLKLNHHFQKVITETKDMDEMSCIAKGLGFKTMLYDGLDSAKKGLTSVEEILRVAGNA